MSETCMVCGAVWVVHNGVSMLRAEVQRRELEKKFRQPRYYRPIGSDDIAACLVAAARDRMDGLEWTTAKRRAKDTTTRALAEAILVQLEERAPDHDCGMGEVMRLLQLMDIPGGPQ